MFAASKTSTAVSAAEADPFFDNVTALVNTSGTNGAQNNTFIDSSTNNFTITRNGNTTQGSFSPFGENWSNFFDGNGDFLQVASNAAFGFGTGDFTVEFWVFPLAGTRQDWIDITNGTQRALLYYSGTAITFYSVPPNAAVITGPAITLNAWAHIAVSKQAGNTRLFVNGTQVGSTYTTSQNYGTAGTVTIGKDSAGSTVITGYMSNVRIVKGTALYTANFTPSTVPLQPVAGTSLLTCRDPNIVDDSPNQFTITRNGDVSVQKFGPFAGTTLPTPYYGAYFDGTGDELSTPTNAAFNLGEGNFTIEMWVNLNVTNVQGQSFFLCTGFNPNMFLWDNGFIYLRTLETSGDIVTPTASGIVAGQWAHIACVRSGNTYSIYINGNLLVSGTSTGVTSVAKQVTIGRNLRGYISNFRIVKGQALYTADFTPSTLPLTTTSQGATASNVSLLTLQSNTFIDNSTNNFTITAVGNTRPTTFAPFAVTYSSLQSYTPAVFGGSGYFDGTGDVLTLGSNAALAFATGDFTIEMWYYTTVAPTSTNVCLYNTGSGNFFIQLRSTAFGIGVVGSTENNAFSASFTAGQWYHLAVARSGATVRGFVNGALVGSGSNSVNYGQSGATVGGLTSSSQLITGYISAFRTVKGTALYTSSFVPSNAPLTAVTNTSLLLNATNAGIYDASTLNVFETVGNAQVSTSVKKYGTSSVALDGTGDYLIAPSNPFNPVLAFGTGAFTVEFWFYANSSSGIRQLFDTRPAGVATTARYMAITYFSGNLNYYTAGANPAIAGGAVATGGWNYVTLTRSGTSTRLFINGIQVGSTYTDSQDYLNGINRPIIGADGADPATANFSGNIQDLRLTRGIARYTANFTPPTAPLPTF